MAIAFNKFDCFVENLVEKVHNLGADALTIALCAAANAPIASNTVLANLTQISYTNLSARVPTISSSAQSSGLYKLVLADHTLTASGGAVAAFQYIVLYNDTPTSPADPLIGWYDFGSSLTLNDTDSMVLDFDASAGALSLV